MRRTLLYLLAIYFVPLVLLSGYFHFQTASLDRANRQRHLQGIAEHQARMLDLFIRERAVDLANLIDRPDLDLRAPPATMHSYLDHLQRSSETFVDLGLFDDEGDQIAYAGPFPVLEERNYQREPWFVALTDGKANFVITDIYLGFRQRPHFTIATNRVRGSRFLALRATLDPDRIYDYITAVLGAKDVLTSIVNHRGVYQVVTPSAGTPLAESALVPIRSPQVGFDRVEIDGSDLEFGYAWLAEADWAIITQGDPVKPDAMLLRENARIAFLYIFVCSAALLITYLWARRMVRAEEDREQTRLQLVHSSKLASVGQLAGGIAHEINNPLAVISEEAGLMMDLMDPAFGQRQSVDDMRPRLERIRDAVFRCRDITRKLLGFVRQTDYQTAECRVADLVDRVVEDFFLHGMDLANIRIERSYADGLPSVITDANQLQQVFVNLLTNAADAIEGPGTILITISADSGTVRIAVMDTGSGMTEDQMQKIFMPFFTTKAVGKGTGLGLSVSSGIVDGLGGSIEVTTEPGRGSTFTVVLPA